MKLEVTIRHHEPREAREEGSLWVPVLKLGALGLAALIVLNRRDIRRYLRLRRM